MEDNFMNGKFQSNLGSITVLPEVISTYAGTVAVECFGIVGMASISVTDGLVRLLKREHLGKGIKVYVHEDNQISLDFHIIVSYGVSIQAVTDNLVENVKYKVAHFTGMEVKNINVYVEDVRVID